MARQSGIRDLQISSAKPSQAISAWLGGETSSTMCCARRSLACHHVGMKTRVVLCTTETGREKGSPFFMWCQDTGSYRARPRAHAASVYGTIVSILLHASAVYFIRCYADFVLECQNSATMLLRRPEHSGNLCRTEMHARVLGQLGKQLEGNHVS